jgi:hypothetical protein
MGIFRDIEKLEEVQYSFNFLSVDAFQNSRVDALWSSSATVVEQHVTSSLSRPSFLQVLSSASRSKQTMSTFAKILYILTMSWVE